MSKIAFLTPFLPYPADTGGKIRSYHILKQLAQHHDVHVITVHGEPWDKAVAHVESFVTHYQHIAVQKPPQTRLQRMLSVTPDHVDAFVSPEVIERVQRIIREGDFDVVFADEIVMAPYVDMSLAAHKVLAIQNIDYELRWNIFQRHSWGRTKLKVGYEYLRLRRFCQQAFQQAWEQVVVCSESDAAVVTQHNPATEVIVTPNGVDTEFYHMDAPTPDSAPTLVFVGSMFYHPNIDAMQYFFADIFPTIQAQVSDVQVYIVGHKPPSSIQHLQRQYEGVAVTGSVDDVRPYLQQSHAVIVPLRLGGGTSLKVVEGIATGRPVVSTSVGCRGLALDDERDLLIRDTADSFAQGVVNVLTDENLRERLVSNGRESIQQYDWRVLTAHMRERIEAAVAQGVNVTR